MVERAASELEGKNIATHDPAIDHFHRAGALLLAACAVTLVCQPHVAAVHIVGDAAAAAAAPLARLLGACLIVPAVTMAAIPSMALNYKSTKRLLASTSIAHLLALGFVATAGAPTSMAIRMVVVYCATVFVFDGSLYLHAAGFT